jgi:predicted ABC-type ATPase
LYKTGQFKYILCIFFEKTFVVSKLINTFAPITRKVVPYLYIIAGCNGAGKTTASYTILPEMLGCKEFVNSDEIAKGLSPFNADNIKVAVEASRIMYKRIRELIAAEKTFALETTLASRSIVKLLKGAQEKGYYVTLLYFWLNTPDLAVERVKNRVAAGGHNVTEVTIRRRYEAGIHNLFELYLPICDYWMITDNSLSPMEIIAKGFRDDKKDIYNSVIYNKLESHE